MKMTTAALLLALGLAVSSVAAVPRGGRFAQPVATDANLKKGLTDFKCPTTAVAIRTTPDKLAIINPATFCIGLFNEVAEDVTVLSDDSVVVQPCTSTLNANGDFFFAEFTLTKVEVPRDDDDKGGKTFAYQIKFNNSPDDGDGVFTENEPSFCLAVDSTVSSVGDGLTAAVCDATRLNQLFFIGKNKDGSFTIKPTGTSLCLQYGRTVGSSVVLATCNDKVANQKFFITSFGIELPNDLLFQIADSTALGDCLVTPLTIDNEIDGETAIGAAPCDITNAQQLFRVRRAAGSDGTSEDDEADRGDSDADETCGDFYQIVTANVCLEISGIAIIGGRDAPGAELRAADCNPADPYQQFEFRGDGRISPRPNPELCLTNDGGVITQQLCQGGVSSQLFFGAVSQRDV